MKNRPVITNLLIVFIFLFGAMGITPKTISVAQTATVLIDEFDADQAYSSYPDVCDDPYTSIFTIQGSGFSSPLEGQIVATEGIVVGDFQEGGKDGYYIQDAEGDGIVNTSDGIFVFAEGGMEVNVGDYVRIEGPVSEYFGLTEISANQAWLCGTETPLPSPTTLVLPADEELDFERLEGMLVSIPQDLVISEYFNYDRYGEIVLTTERFMTFTALNEPDVTAYAASLEEYFLSKITLDDGRSSQNPDPAIHPNGDEFTLSNLYRGGDLVANVTGILDYSYDLYRIQPTQGADYTAVNARTATPDIVEGDLKVASFNVLNYFTTIDTGSNICGPSGNLECRGADTTEELARQRAKILAAMSEIDADIFGLMEIENDRPGPDPDYAVADLVAGLNDLMGAGTYTYVETGFIGSDAIKVALIYKPGSVSLVGDYQVLNSDVDPRFVDTKNRPTLAQTFQDTVTGEDFVVAVNHLKSKGSDCNSLGDYDLGDGAGNCNLTRLAAAEAMVDWLDNETYFPGVDDFLIIGDLNSYDKEDPIDAIKKGSDDTIGTADDYIDMIHQLLGEESYGYVFDGHIGYLDYALTNKKMSDAVVDVTIWHINADEPDLIDYDMTFKQDPQDALFAPDAYRSSDHDPVIVSLTFPTTPEAYDDAYGLEVDTTLEITAEFGVLANDYDPNGDVLSPILVEGVDPVNEGTLVLNGDGSFTFTPVAGFLGEATFTYRAYDGEFQSDVATVTITVTHAPVANSDPYSTDEDVPLSIDAPGVLANDTDQDSDTLTAVLVTDVSNGLLTLNEDGSFIYTPDLNYHGSDSFWYKANDGALDSEPVEVMIDIISVNDAPIGVDDYYETNVDLPLSVSAPGVLANDTDPDGDPLTIVFDTSVHNGTLDLLVDGSFVYRPNKGYVGVDSFTYKAYDGTDYSEVVTVNITVNSIYNIFLPIINK